MALVGLVIAATTSTTTLICVEHDHHPLQIPQRTWEMLQIGNNGSPIELEEGWLLLTHAVGPMRKYTLSMTLLDKNDPTIVLSQGTVHTSSCDS